MKYIILWVRIAFGVHSLVSGTNYFFHYSPLPPLEGSPSGPFITEMDEVGLFAAIKVVETFVGVCLLTNRFVPLALAVELPVTFSIFYLNTFVDASARQVFTGPRELFYNVFLLICYAGYYAPLANVLSQPRPLWTQPARDEIVRGLKLWK